MVGAMLMGYKVAEYPAVLHARIFGVSKAKLMRTIMDHLKFQGRVLLHRLHLGSVVRRSRTVGG
jgi:dolichol-phosphate mannosyltransferase